MARFLDADELLGLMDRLCAEALKHLTKGKAQPRATLMLDVAVQFTTEVAMKLDACGRANYLELATRLEALERNRQRETD